MKKLTMTAMPRHKKSLLVVAALLFMLPLFALPLVTVHAEECEKSGRRAVMSKRAAFRYCAPQAVNIKILGHDANGKWVSYGAGSILHENGYILTAEHVTAAGDKHTITLQDGTTYEYKVLGRAGGSYDTAIIKVEPNEPLPHVTLGHSDLVKRRETAMVIGNASGEPHTLNYGVVEKVACGGGTQIHVGKSNIKPGDSGGPVFNLRGEQIAHVHVKIYTLKNASRHIRVDHLRDAFAKVFMDESRYEYGIGIEVDCHANEAVVTKVRRGSPAARANVKVGDVITKFCEMRIGNGPDYVMALMDSVTAEPVTLTLMRDGETITKEITPQRN